MLNPKSIADRWCYEMRVWLFKSLCRAGSFCRELLAQMHVAGPPQPDGSCRVQIKAR